MIWTLSKDGEPVCSVYFSDEHGAYIVEDVSGAVVYLAETFADAADQAEYFAEEVL